MKRPNCRVALDQRTAERRRALLRALERGTVATTRCCEGCRERGRLYALQPYDDPLNVRWLCRTCYFVRVGNRPTRDRAIADTRWRK